MTFVKTPLPVYVASPLRRLSSHLKNIYISNNFVSNITYNFVSVGVYTESDGELLCLLQGQSGGVTHVIFSPDATKLYSGGRMVCENNNLYHFTLYLTS